MNNHAQHGIESGDLDSLVRHHQGAMPLWARGQIARFFQAVRHADDMTLMSPFGAYSEGIDRSPERIAVLEGYFTGGEGHVEVIRALASGDLAVLVTIEHQHGTIGGLPDQDWSLRVTVVYRREAEGWKVVHRHADPLVRGIELEPLAELARGARR